MGKDSFDIFLFHTKVDTAAWLQARHGLGQGTAPFRSNICQITAARVRNRSRPTDNYPTRRFYHLLQQHSRTCDVGIYVESDRLFSGRRFDTSQRLGAATPHRLALALVMRDHHGTARPAGCVESFIERFEQLVALVSHVGGVDPLKRRQLSGQCFDLCRWGCFIGWVKQPSGKSTCAGGKTLTKESTHLLDLGLGRWPV